LRVSGGGLNLELPTGFDYASESAIFGIQRLNLSPEGREMMGEVSWSSPMAFGPFAGNAGVSTFYRHNPGHIADYPADIGAVMSLSAQF